MQVTQDDLTAVSSLVRDLCGLVLDNSKGYLIENRLSRLAASSGCGTFADLARKARTGKDPSLSGLIVDAITTQETLFFRDGTPFDCLRNKVLPDLIDLRTRTRAPKRLRFWSAASSTGQEAYSLAMTISETIPDLPAWNVNILGTDISDAAVRYASRGAYGSHETQRGMKPELLRKYFTPEAGGYRVRDSLRALAAFSRRNLLAPVTDLGPFDVIFCRNVAIYFDQATRRDLFQRLAQRLVPGGYLFVGSAECLTDLGPRFAPRHHCGTTFYQPNG